MNSENGMNASVLVSTESPTSPRGLPVRHVIKEYTLYTQPVRHAGMRQSRFELSSWRSRTRRSEESHAHKRVSIEADRTSYREGQQETTTTTKTALPYRTEITETGEDRRPLQPAV